MSVIFQARPLGGNSMFAMPGYQVWCGSMVQDEQGACHLYFSFWPEKYGFDAWVTHSVIGYARAETPDDHYQFKGTILPGSGRAGSFDRDVTHNPTIQCFDGRYYLYYTGNFSDSGDWWDHRNHQRIGAAYSETPGGTMIRAELPVIEHPGAVMASNPSVCRLDSGRYLMIYKWVAADRPAPFYGPVFHGGAVADNPMGPFEIFADNLFHVEKAFFPGEDPFVFTRSGRLFCLIKDNATNYSPEPKSLILFESTDEGRNWRQLGVALTRNFVYEGGSGAEFFRVERPQITFCRDQIRLFAAVKPYEDREESFSINTRLDSGAFFA